MGVRIVCISDTHGQHAKTVIPDGDLLLCSGDITSHGQVREVERFDQWLATLPHPHKVVIAGNHDFCFQEVEQESRALIRHAHYLQDEGVTIEGLKIYGSPWQPVFCRMAFNLTAPYLRQRWAAIPDDTDVLLTHGPPHMILDRTSRGHHAGCAELVARLQTLKVKLHLFGHIHEGYGQVQKDTTVHVNAALCDLSMRLSNDPVIIDL